MHFIAAINVRFKKSVLEPQGAAIQLALEETGHKGIGLIRVGKHIEIDVEADSEEDALKKIESISEELLYNPVMEVCEISISEKK